MVTECREKCRRICLCPKPPGRAAMDRLVRPLGLRFLLSYNEGYRVNASETAGAEAGTDPALTDQI